MVNFLVMLYVLLYIIHITLYGEFSKKEVREVR